MTWRLTAKARGFTNLGNGTWLAPNGQRVAEGFVRRVCTPDRETFLLTNVAQ